MLIFHSYNSLPEARTCFAHFLKTCFYAWQCPWGNCHPIMPTYSQEWGWAAMNSHCFMLLLKLSLFLEVHHIYRLSNPVQCGIDKMMLKFISHLLNLKQSNIVFLRKNLWLCAKVRGKLQHMTLTRWRPPSDVCCFIDVKAPNIVESYLDLSTMKPVEIGFSIDTCHIKKNIEKKYTIWYY